MGIGDMIDGEGINWRLHIQGIAWIATKAMNFSGVCFVVLWCY